MAHISRVNLDLHLKFFRARRWWRDSRRLGRILEALRRNDLWFDFRYLGVEAGALQPFDRVEQVLGASVDWQKRTYVLHTRGDIGMEASVRASHISFSVSGGTLWLQLSILGPELQQRRATLIDQLIGFVRQILSDFPGVIRIDSGSYASVDGLRHASVRPPRVETRWSYGHLFDVLDPMRLEKTPLADDARRLLDARLPAGAERIEERGVVFLRWARDLVDEGDVSLGLARQERFFVDTLNPRPIAAYNDVGDKRVKPSSAEVRPPLTAYDRAEHIGYQVLRAEADGSVDEKGWAQVSAWARAGRLPDGAPLAGVRVIVPRRPAATALHGRALADGIEAVLYRDDGGGWWDPFPPGLWQD